MKKIIFTVSLFIFVVSGCANVNDGTNAIVFTQPYNNVEDILAEYNQAREKQLKLIQESNTRDLGHFSTSQLDGADKMVDALLVEKENIETALEMKIDETVLVRQVTKISY